MTAIGVQAGLDGVVAAETRLSGVDGQAGELIIAGFAVEELAPQATFEEVVYLLWHDTLPTPAQLSEFQRSVVKERTLPPIALAVLEATAAQQTSPMDALRMAAGTLSLNA